MMGIADAKLPLNVNDTDLDPNMHEFPKPREGATDMIFCQLRYEFGTFFVQLTKPNAHNSFEATAHSSHPVDNTAVSMAKKDEIIDGLEQTLQQKFLKYCDPLIPLHNLTAIAARAAVCGMRLRAHHPRQYADGGASLSQSEKDTLFLLSFKIMQYDTLIHATPALHKYLWHVRVYFQWHALIYLLTDMRFRKVGKDAERAWDQVEDVYKYHPEMLNQNDYALYSAIRILTWRAWESRKAELMRLNLPIETPPIVWKLQEKGVGIGRLPVVALDNIAVPNGLPSASQDAFAQLYGPGRTSGSSECDNTMAEEAKAFEEPSPVDWEQWDNLLRSMDLPDLDTSLDSFFK
jgi:hypothetical protein